MIALRNSYSNELKFSFGDRLTVYDVQNAIWWLAKNAYGASGYVRKDAVKEIDLTYGA